MASPRVRLSFWDNVRTKYRREIVDLSLTELSERFSERLVVEVSSLDPNELKRAKATVPVFSGAEFNGEEGRKKTDVVAIHTAVVDVDYVEDSVPRAFGHFDKIAEVLAQEGLAALLYTTWSAGKKKSGKPGVKLTWPEDGRGLIDQLHCRLILPLDKAITNLEDWTYLWRGLNLVFGAQYNGNSKYTVLDPAYENNGVHLSDVPARASLDPFKQHKTQLFLGTPVEVDAFVNIGKTLPSIRKKQREYGKVEEGHPLDRLLEPAQVQHWNDQRKKEGTTYPYVKKLLAGKALVGYGGRDVILTEVTQALAGRFGPQPEGFVESLFDASIEAMRQEAASKGWDYDDLTIENVLDKYDRACANVEAQEAEREQRQEEVLRDTFSFLGRDSVYSDEELTTWLEELAPNTTLPKQKMSVLYNNNTFYFFRQGSYESGMVRGDAELCYHRYMSVFPYIDFIKTNPSGNVTYKTFADCVKDYGHRVSKVSYSYTAAASSLQEPSIDNLQLILPTAPRRKVTPLYHPRIHNWLQAFAGPEAETLEKWLAGFLLFDRPHTALYLKGDSGQGKSFLPQALAHFWVNTKQPVKAEEVLTTDFNQRLLISPLVWADETFPKDKSGQLRTLVTTGTHAINQKYRDHVELEGFLRFVFCTNNDDILQLGSLNASDVEAVAARITNIEVQKEGIEYVWQSRMHEDQEGVKQELIEHVQWLQDVKYAAWLEQMRGSRFLVRGATPGFVLSLGMRSDPIFLVSLWLLKYLLERELWYQRCSRDSRPAKQVQMAALLQIRKNNLYVQSRGLIENWDVYGGAERPKAKEVSSAVVAISDPKRKKLTAYKDNKKKDYYQKYYMVKREALYVVSEQAGYASPAEIDRALQKDTPISVMQDPDLKSMN